MKKAVLALSIGLALSGGVVNAESGLFDELYNHQPSQPVVVPPVAEPAPVVPAPVSKPAQTITAPRVVKRRAAPKRRVIQKTSDNYAEREGFIIGGGIGLMNTNIESSGGYYNNTVDIDLGTDLLTNFIIGYAFTDQFALHYTNTAAWDADILVGLTGVGATYWISDEPQSVYLRAALGAGSMVDPDGYYESSTGSAWSLGAGYEFIKHYSIEGSMMGLSVDDSYYSDTSIGFGISINALYY